MKFFKKEFFPYISETIEILNVVRSTNYMVLNMLVLICGSFSFQVVPVKLFGWRIFFVFSEKTEVLILAREY